MTAAAPLSALCSAVLTALQFQETRCELAPEGGEGVIPGRTALHLARRGRGALQRGGCSGFYYPEEFYVRISACMVRLTRASLAR